MSLLITEGWFSNVSVHDNKVYAADQNNNEIKTFTHRGGRLNLLKRIRRGKPPPKFAEGASIQLPFSKKSKHISFRVTKNKLSVCSNFHHEIHTAALDASPIQFRVTYTKPSGKQPLSSELYICSEFNGNLLVADRRNNSFFTLGDDGVAQTELQPLCSQPNCAVVDSGFLFAMSNSKQQNSLKKYRLL